MTYAVVGIGNGRHQDEDRLTVETAAGVAVNQVRADAPIVAGVRCTLVDFCLTQSPCVACRHSGVNTLTTTHRKGIFGGYLTSYFILQT